MRFFLLFFSTDSRHSHLQALHCLRVLSLLTSDTFYLIYFSRCSPPRPRTSPSRSILILSFFPSVGGVPIFPGDGNSSVTNHEVVSVRRLIRAEPAFPVRGMLAHFPHAFAGGASCPCCVLRSGHSLPGGGAGGVVVHISICV
jgi:hypothetical protein